MRFVVSCLRSCPNALGIRTPPSTPHFTYTPTSERNLRSLALAVCQGKPILLQGLTGAGKTVLVEQLAHLTRNTGTTIPFFFPSPVAYVDVALQT